MKRLQEIEARKMEIRSLLEGEQEVNVEEIDAEINELNEEKEALEKRARMANGITAGNVPATIIEKEERGASPMTEVIETVSTPEYRSAFLKRLMGKELSPIEQRTLTSVANSAGASIPTQTLNLILDKMRQTSVLLPKVNVSYVPSNISIVVANAKNAAAWHAEGAAATAADDTVLSVTLGGYELIKLVEMSITVNTMSISAFEAYVAAEIGRQLAIAIENAILNGTGTAQPTGILSGLTWTLNTNWIQYTTLAYDNFVDGLALLPTLYHPTATFVMNRKTMFSGLRKLKDTTGAPLFTYNPQDAAAYRILGYPVIVDDYVADDVILLGDLNYYYLNMSQPPMIETSREAGFYTGKVVYRGMAVLDGKPALAEAFVKISK